MTRPALGALRRRVLALAGLLAVFGAMLLPALAASAASPSTSQPTASARTGVGVAGGPFAGLKVTVDQTTNLTNQVVRVHWTGGVQTQPAERFGVDYLQVMQCWGDEASGPTREQCQFGGKVAFDTRGGEQTASRQLATNASLKDPKEQLTAEAAPDSLVNVPFRSVTGTVVTDVLKNEFFDSSTSNEVPFARTRPNGAGDEFFEMQTDTEAPGLGCGKVVRGKPRACWLVVVPRGEQEVDGSKRTPDTVNQLRTSPLSQTNWEQRISFPLSFAPVGEVCPIGAAERRTVGVETTNEAVVRWQPVLCGGGKTVFGYSQVTDAVAIRQLATTQPGMAFLSQPVPAAQAPKGKSLTYAPVALSGLTVSFLIESQGSRDAAESVKADDGVRLANVKLTPRLVAKLVTQSYRLGVDADAAYLQDNPSDLGRDPDFLALNPGFKDLSLLNPIAELITPIGSSAINRTLWTWIAGDGDARAFLQGFPDRWGMKVNPYYQGVDAPRDDFPKLDPFCHIYTTGPLPLCTLDRHPYSADMHEAARAVSRGDSLSRSAWDPNASPPSYKKTPAQLSGRRALLALADTATASRFGLIPAQLENVSGSFVTPTDASLLAGQAAMTPSPENSAVLTTNAVTRSKAAYPLPLLTYATTVPSALTPAEATDYATFIRYASGKGQTPGVEPGTLPAGYVPLPAALRTQATAAALATEQRRNDSPMASTAVLAKATVAGAEAGAGTAGPVGGGGGGGADLSGGTAGAEPGSGSTATSGEPAPSGAAPPAASLPPAASAAPIPARAPTLAEPPAVSAVASRTPGLAMGLIRYVLPIAFVLGLLAFAGGPALTRLSRRSRR